MLPTILQEKASKMIVSCEASSKFHRTSFQNERFARCFRQFLRKICVSLQFRAIDTPLPARGFIRQKQNVPRTTTPCIPKFQNVVSLQRRAQKCMNLSTVNRPASRTQKSEVLLQFWAIDTTILPRGLIRRKWNLRFATVSGDRHHVFIERVARRQMKFAFRYSYGRSTPRFYGEGWSAENEICVSLQFWSIDTTFLARGLTARKWNLRFARVLGDRRRVFSERVDFRLTLPIPPGGIE